MNPLSDRGAGIGARAPFRWGGAALLFAVIAACGGRQTTPTARLPELPAAGRLRTLSGRYVNLAALRGQATLITIIQTWSDYALTEVPLMNKVAEDYGDRLNVLCVALDDQPEMVQIFIDTFKPDYEVLRVDSVERFTGESGPFGPITRVPTSVLLDAEGRVAARMDGTWQPAVLLEVVEKLVGPPQG